MSHLRATQAKAQQESVVSYTPIAHSLLMLEESERDRLQRKFNICYMMAKEGVAFKKYAVLHELHVEVCHGVHLGLPTKPVHQPSCSHTIAESQSQQLLQALA